MEVDFVLSRLNTKRELQIIDVGSHHGEFLDIFERHVDEHVFNVVCVEPMSENVLVLRQKSGTYKRVKVKICDVALSDTSGVKTFYQGSVSTLFTCTPEWTEHFRAAFVVSRQVPTKCATFDELFDQFQIARNLPFDFIKIDTEGHDLNVLRSMVAAHIRPFALMFEIGLDLVSTASAVSLLRLNGFTEFFVFARTGIPTTFIGEWQDLEQIQGLQTAGKLLAGNIVAF
jgi:FkbM family methyltransferase